MEGHRSPWPVTSSCCWVEAAKQETTPRAPHSPDTGGTRGRPAPPLQLAQLQAPRAHRRLSAGGRGADRCPHTHSTSGRLQQPRRRGRDAVLHRRSRAGDAARAGSVGKAPDGQSRGAGRHRSALCRHSDIHYGRDRHWDCRRSSASRSGRSPVPTPRARRSRSRAVTYSSCEARKIVPQGLVLERHRRSGPDYSRRISKLTRPSRTARSHGALVAVELRAAGLRPRPGPPRAARRRRSRRRSRSRSGRR